MFLVQCHLARSSTLRYIYGEIISTIFVYKKPVEKGLTTWLLKRFLAVTVGRLCFSNKPKPYSNTGFYFGRLFPTYDFKSAGFFWALSLFLNFQFNVVCSVFFPLLAQKAPFWLWKVLNSPPEAFKCMFFQANTVDKMASEVVCIFGLRKMCRIYKITEIGNINISRYSSLCRK